MFFWDHVHLTPEGNFAAATSFAAALEPILATRGLSPQRATPSWDELSDRVILTDWDRLNASVAMHTRMLRPPFDSLGTHHEIVGRLTREITALRKRVTRENVEMIRDKLQVAAQAHPDDFHLLSRLGRLFEELGQYPQSLDVQEIMMRTWPHVRSVRSAYGRALVRAGRVEDGLRELEQGEIPGTLRPRLIALIEASSVLAEMGRIDEAIGLLDRALALEPAYAKALHNRAIIYSRTGRDAEAEADYKEAVRIDPGLVESLNNLAVMAIRRNNLEQAESYLREAVRQHPLHISSLRNLSLVTMKRGDWETAFACSSKLSYLDPEFEDIAQMQKVPAKP
jgi:Flp pilus assembly protein TadD